MKKTYTSNYVKIYFWQGISIALGFLALFIITPKLTSVPILYGVYSICIATTFFLTYADIGFLGAGYKYVSEKFAVNDLNEEIRIVGFVSFILFISVLLFSAAMLIFSINPHILIGGLNNPKEIGVASKLLLILAIFSPTIILQRMCQMVFGVRLEDFIYQRLAILSNLLRICSIFYFFNGDKYDIVGYFLFFQSVGLISAVLFLIIIKIRYRYSFGLLARSFRFSTEIYNQTRKLAFGSFFTTLIFILYYELDLFAIGKLSGAEMAGFYGVGLTIMSFFRGITGTIYGPFLTRFNHFTGLKDLKGLKEMFYGVIILTLPLVVFPIISIAMLMKPIILCWVGPNYTISIIVAQFLAMSLIYSFIAQPASILISAQVRVKTMCAISIIAVFIYWTGIIATFHSMGILAFAVFKFIAFTISAILYFIICGKFLEYKPGNLLKRIIGPAVIPVLFLIVILAYAGKFMPAEKNKIELLFVIGTGGLASFMALCLYYMSSAYFKNYVNGAFAKLIKA